MFSFATAVFPTKHDGDTTIVWISKPRNCSLMDLL